MGRRNWGEERKKEKKIGKEERKRDHGGSPMAIVQRRRITRGKKLEEKGKKK